MPQIPLGELTALPKPLAVFGGLLRGREGMGWEERGRRGKWRGGKDRAPKLLLNQGPSEHCYATGYDIADTAMTDLHILSPAQKITRGSYMPPELARSPSKFSGKHIERSRTVMGI